VTHVIRGVVSRYGKFGVSWKFVRTDSENLNSAGEVTKDESSRDSRRFTATRSHGSLGVNSVAIQQTYLTTICSHLSDTIDDP